MAEHARILQSRYKQLLGSAGNLDAVASKLYSHGLLTLVEKEEIKKRGNKIDKEAYLCSSLTAKGVSKLVEISQLIKNEQARQGSSAEAARLPHGGGGGMLPGIEKWASSHEDAIGGEVGRCDGRQLRDVGGNEMSREKCASPGHRMPVFFSKPNVVEDTYSVLFFTFITQLLHHFSGMSDQTPPKAMPSWLQVDLLVETTREYFSSRALKDISPNERNPVAIKLSLLLESFQQLYHAFRSFKSKNLSLHEKLLEATKIKERLEAEVSRMRSNRLQQNPSFGVVPYLPASSSGDRALHLLEAKKAEIEALKRSYARSEQRCKQLVVVTQQWALECEDKVKLIHLQEQQLKEVRAEVAQLERRVSKYKKFWVEYKSRASNVAAAVGGGDDGRVSDFQFEELRTELAMRRELYDMVLGERDQAQKEVSRLMSELESLKDHNVQLADRAANYQVQAKAKEPAVREMSGLLEENRRLKSELDAANSDKNALQSRIKALETRVDSLQGSVVVEKPRPSSASSSGSSHMIDHATPPQTHRREHHSEITDKGNPKAFLHSYPEDDTYSLSSSEGDSNSYYSSHNSSTTTTSQSGLTSFPATGSRPGSAPSSGVRPFSQLESRDGSVVYMGDSSPGHSGELMPSEVGFQEGGDYTRAIRYPNHSKIHVAPLVEEDRRVLKPPPQQHQQGIGDDRGLNRSNEQLVKRNPVRSDYSGDKMPLQLDRISLRDEGGGPSRVYRSDRICPSCDFVFHSLSDAEFDAHKLSCRGKSISI